MNQEIKERSLILSIIFLFRPNRTIMVAAITGTAAFASGADAGLALLMTLGGWFLAVGGFSLDFFADRELDKVNPRSTNRNNPIASGKINPYVGLVFSVIFIMSSLVIFLIISPWSLITWTLIVMILIGLATHILDKAILRALSLGLLQALYCIMGASVGTITIGIGLLAAMFFFAMFGGRGVTDIRDFPLDKETTVETLPKRYGMKRTAQFTAINLLIAYALSLGVYFTKEFNSIYLYLDIVFIVTGLVITGLFLFKYSPKLAKSITMIYMMGQGLIICTAIILGKIIF